MILKKQKELFTYFHQWLILSGLGALGDVKALENDFAKLKEDLEIEKYYLMKRKLENKKQ